MPIKTPVRKIPREMVEPRGDGRAHLHHHLSHRGAADIHFPPFPDSRPAGCLGDVITRATHHTNTFSNPTRRVTRREPVSSGATSSAAEWRRTRLTPELPTQLPDAGRSAPPGGSGGRRGANPSPTSWGWDCHRLSGDPKAAVTTSFIVRTAVAGSRKASTALAALVGTGCLGSWTSILRPIRPNRGANSEHRGCPALNPKVFAFI